MKRQRIRSNRVTQRVKRAKVKPTTSSEYLVLNPTSSPLLQKTLNEIVVKQRRTINLALKEHRVSVEQSFNVTSLQDIYKGIDKLIQRSEYAGRIQIYLGTVGSGNSSQREVIMSDSDEDDDPSMEQKREIKRAENENVAKLWGARSGNGMPMFIDNMTQVADPQRYHDRASINAIKAKITIPLMKEMASRNKRASTMIIRGIYSVKIKVFKTNQLFGNGSENIPSWLLKSSSIKTIKAVKYNLCFFQCLAIHLEKADGRSIQPAIKLFETFHRRYYINPVPDLKNYQGIDFSFDVPDNDEERELDDVDKAEDLFDVNITIYTINSDRQASLIRRSMSQSKNKIYLLAHGNHLMYIKRGKRDVLFKFVQCENCFNPHARSDHKREHQGMAPGHIDKCITTPKENFTQKDQIYQPQSNIIIEVANLLGNVHITDTNFLHRYHLAFDYEALLKTLEIQGNKIQRTHLHVPISVSVASNVPGFESACFVSEDEQGGTINKSLVKFMLQASDAARKLSEAQLCELFDVPNYEALENRLEPLIKSRDLSTFRLEKFLAWSRQLPCVGYNIGRYDINLSKKFGLINELQQDCKEQSMFVAKKANNYMSLGTDRLSIIDMINYVPPGTSYAAFLKNTGSDLEKSHFPYEWFDSIDKLKATRLPDPDAFFSTLKGCNTLGESKEEIYETHQELLTIWKTQNMQTFKDFLIFYNDRDVVPFVPAITKQKDEYARSYRIDMLKDAISIPGVAEIAMFQSAASIKKELPVLVSKTLDRHRMRKKIKRYFRTDLHRVKNLTIPTADERLAELNYKIKFESDPNELKTLQQSIETNERVLQAKVRGTIMQARKTKVTFDHMLKDWYTLNKKKVDEKRAYYVHRKKVLEKQYQELKTGKMENFLTVEAAQNILDKQERRCIFCCIDLSNGGFRDLTFDRIDNMYCHTINNVNACCKDCNVDRGSKSFDSYMRISVSKRQEQDNPQIHLITEENKSVFHKLKSAVVGGPSIIFSRYQKSNETRIMKPKFNTQTKTWSVRPGKLVKKLVGFDANALYLWCQSQVMPCGRLEMRKAPNDREDFLHDVLRGAKFGFVEVDIHTPDHLINTFQSFPPLFKNMHIGPDLMSEHMKKMFSQNGKDLPHQFVGNRKLVSVLKADKILLYTPLLKWLLEHGLEVTKVHSWISAQPNFPFKKFTEDVTNARIEGDRFKHKKVKADCAKLIGNSAFGRTGMNKNKHTNIRYMTDVNDIKKKICSWQFQDLNIIEQKTPNMPALVEVQSLKRDVKQNKPIQVASAIYQLAKLRMLEFRYDCVGKFLDKSDYQEIEMDTDSLYFALSGNSLDELVKPELRAQYYKEKYDWFPDNRTPESKAITRRTPGLFKVEWTGDVSICLNSKTYYFGSNDDPDRPKIAAKGVQKIKNKASLTEQKYMEALHGAVIPVKANGFLSHDHMMKSYQQQKIGLTTFYDKRATFDDGITTHCIM